MHGGTVHAASPGLGQGSTFTLRLPLAPDVERASEEASERPAPSQSRATSVLVVDDNEDAAEMLALVLGRSGYLAKTAYDGRAALAAVGEWTPEVVILDIGLPDMDGYDVARALREDGRLSELALIALTGWGTHDDKRKAIEAGFDVHLTKPVDAGDLQRALAQLGRRPRARAASAG
jgi:CheY-like chemotaxis protein